MEYWIYIGCYLFLIFWVKMYGASKPPAQYPGTPCSSIPTFQLWYPLRQCWMILIRQQWAYYGCFRQDCDT
jgi:hypothetical protein